MVDDERVRAVWETELARLELDLIRAERLHDGLSTMPTEPWDPPAIPGQMPADLATRAQELLDRQDQAMAELRTGLAAAHKQISYGDRLTGATGRGPALPVYLDLEI